MSTYALIKDEVVINVIEWAGPEESPMTFDTGVTYVDITNQVVVIGATYIDGVFTNPA